MNSENSPEGELIEIYKIHVQSADKLDERRDATIRIYGGMCVIVAATAMGTFADFKLVSSGLSIILFLLARGWLLTVQSLNAKLNAKNCLLLELERGLTIQFLFEERKIWESFGNRTHIESLEIGPHIFMFTGLLGLVVSGSMGLTELWENYNVYFGI